VCELHFASQPLRSDLRPVPRCRRLSGHGYLLALVLTICLLPGCTSEVEPMILQVRWCVLEGSSETGVKEPGDLVSTHRRDEDALVRANEL
jgi:hypothetical protein